MKKTAQKSIAKALHKWIGLMVAIFMLLFCISGIILNHRTLFSSCSVSRSLMPTEYRIKNFNNGIIKGTLKLQDGRILAYGNAGMWITDDEFQHFEDFNTRIPEGIEHRNIRNVVQSNDGQLTCAANFGAYQHDGDHWIELTLPGNNDRIADVTLEKDSVSPVILTRSAIYRKGENGFERTELKGAVGIPVKFTLFKTLWMLHSGELFGIGGKIIVDIVAMVMIFLSITGIIIFILPNSIRKSTTEKKLAQARALKWNFRWHDKIGYVTIILTIIIAFTGICLRPPLMIPAVLIKTSALPGTTLDSKNAWNDRMRAIRWDEGSNSWLISTSEGFLRVDEYMQQAPRLIDTKTTPPVSPMGVNVFEKVNDGDWIIGSFSGMYRWNSETGKVTDFFTQATYKPGKTSRPTSEQLIAGYSKDLKGKETIFDYSSGWSEIAETPELLRIQPISLWNFALELHVGRCYSPIIGPFSSLFIFLSGLLLVTVLITGLILHKRMHPGRTRRASLPDNDNNINQ